MISRFAALAGIFSKELDPDKAAQTYQAIIDSSPDFRRDAYMKLAQVYRHYRHIIRAQGTMPDLVALLQQVDAAQVKANIDRHFPPQPLIAVLRPPTLKEIVLKIGPIALVLGGIGVVLLRWSHRRRINAVVKK